jgi:hypothetical protein
MKRGRLVDLDLERTGKALAVLRHYEVNETGYA